MILTTVNIVKCIQYKEGRERGRKRLWEKTSKYGFHWMIDLKWIFSFTSLTLYAWIRNKYIHPGNRYTCTSHLDPFYSASPSIPLISSHSQIPFPFLHSLKVWMNLKSPEKGSGLALLHFWQRICVCKHKFIQLPWALQNVFLFPAVGIQPMLFTLNYIPIFILFWGVGAIVGITPGSFVPSNISSPFLPNPFFWG